MHVLCILHVESALKIVFKNGLLLKKQTKWKPLLFSTPYFYNKKT